MESTSEIIILLTGLFGLAIILLSFIYFQRKFSKDETPSVDQNAQATSSSGRRRRGMRSVQRSVQQETVDEDSDEASTGPTQEIEDELDFNGMTERQIRKAMRRREKQEQRRVLEESRRAAEDLREKKQQKYREKQAQREAERIEKRNEALERAKKEKEKAKEEYDKWKDLFSVEQEGSNVADAVESTNLLTEFLDYVRSKKVILIEEMSSVFELRVPEAMNRLEALEKMGRLTGIFDDRGKFIYVTPSELNAVAEFMQRKGRISISELAKKSNKLIDLSSAPEPELTAEVQEEIDN